MEAEAPLAVKDDWHVCVYAETPALCRQHSRRRSKEQAGIMTPLLMLRSQCIAPQGRNNISLSASEQNICR